MVFPAECNSDYWTASLKNVLHLESKMESENYLDNTQKLTTTGHQSSRARAPDAAHPAVVAS